MIPSKLLAELWRNETDEVRRKVADRKKIKIKMEHMQLYPGYVFQPEDLFRIRNDVEEQLLNER